MKITVFLAVSSDLGVHIDGYVAVQAATMIVGADETSEITGKAADVLQCAQTCLEAALRLIRPGKRIVDVAGPLNQIAGTYGCSLVDGVMTHNMKQFVIDGNKCILNKPFPDQKVEDAPIEEFEAYAVDIVVSTGVFCAGVSSVFLYRMLSLLQSERQREGQEPE
jgi:methionine aminopeptidase